MGNAEAIFQFIGIWAFIGMVAGLHKGMPFEPYVVGIFVGIAAVYFVKNYLRRKKIADYPTNWEDMRKEVLERDNKQCCNCASRTNLHVHHIVPLSCGGQNKNSNLITLCERCHTSLHPHMRE